MSMSLRSGGSGDDTSFSIQGSVMSGTQATRGTKAKYLRTVMARLVCYLARSPVNTKGPSQKKALSAFLATSYSVSLLRAKVPTSLPLPAEKTACTEKVSLSPHSGVNEIGTSTERIDEGAIGPTGSGIGSRTLALQPWLPILETIVKLFSSVCVAAELPPLASVTCHRRRPADPAWWVAAAITECPQ
jgi:hypothetical protein